MRKAALNCHQVPAVFSVHVVPACVHAPANREGRPREKRIPQMPARDIPAPFQQRLRREVQIYRMFEEVVINTEQDPAPSGTILHAVKERLEVLMKPKMFYELQRGVKKLRF